MYCLNVDENRNGCKITVVRPSHPREPRALAFTDPRDAMVVDGKVSLRLKTLGPWHTLEGVLIFG
jgi:hypothetical protein